LQTKLFIEVLKNKLFMKKQFGFHFMWLVLGILCLQSSSCCKKDENPTNAATYGDVITIQHVATSQRLHSHPFNYEHPQTSGQQQITAYNGALDLNDYWMIKGAHANVADLNKKAVKDNDIIRLEHLATGKNLHSHSGRPSPVTKQQEVTCFGINGIGDTNDDWKIQIEGGGAWEKGKKIRLVHVNTGYRLHSHTGQSHAQWTKGQQEVTAYSRQDDNDFWSFLGRK
jgi:dolichyl-phosphate-mannose--protein O-mannosyl transferase